MFQTTNQYMYNIYIHIHTNIDIKGSKNIGGTPKSSILLSDVPLFFSSSYWGTPLMERRVEDIGNGMMTITTIIVRV